MDIRSGETITLNLNDSAAAAISTATFTYGIDGTTVQDFLDYMNDNLDNVQLYLQEDPVGGDSIGMLVSDEIDADSLVLTTTATASPNFMGANATATAGPNTAGGNAIATATTEKVEESDFFSDAKLNSLLLRVRSAELDVRQQITSYATDITLIQRRMDFSEMMINTLELGATDLIIADTNEEGANMLTLQTRQSLSNTALSLAAQAEQGVLNLF